MKSKTNLLERAFALGKRTNMLLVFILLTLIICCGHHSATAQTFSEFFRQKSTQRKYLMESILAYKTYATVAWKGYKNLRKGWRTISDIANGEQKLHLLYFESLGEVNPLIKKNPLTAEILEMCQKIYFLMGRRIDINGLSRSTVISDMKSQLLNDCENNLQELDMLLTNRETKMTDKARLNKLHAIHGAVRNTLELAMQFTMDMELMKGGEHEND
ncbi:MAG: hypothetical protein LBF27_30960 [Sphingobacterium sp.]|jgi:hypothetical protein|nr:hypothetical protein [Sphingobacterium sp.]